MKLVFIHGAPGAGKLTTARALAVLTNARLFDNHAAIDVARTIFEFGAPGFWELVERIRIDVLDAAAKENVPLVVMTCVYAEPEDISTFERYEAVVCKHGAEVLPVFLRCDAAEIERRVGNPDRVARKKMTSDASARAFLQKYHICAVPRVNCLTLDSTATDATTNAAAIARHFGLDRG